MKTADEDRRSRFHEEMRKNWGKDPASKKLLESGALAAAIKLLEDRQRIERRHSIKSPLDIWIVQAATNAARERDIVDRMTASERKKLEFKIRESVDALESALVLFHGENGFSHYFQPDFDGLAAGAACDYEEWCEQIGVQFDEEMRLRCRFTVYHMLMFNLGAIFDAIRCGADYFSTREPIIKKPNDKNANRLHFIRKLNNSLCDEFGSPCRSAALVLTSAFFDCSDLDEAALSKLAPRYVAKPYVLPQEAIDQLRDFYASRGRLSELEDISPNFKAELNPESDPKSSAE